MSRRMNTPGKRTISAPVQPNNPAYQFRQSLHPVIRQGLDFLQRHRPISRGLKWLGATKAGDWVHSKGFGRRRKRSHRRRR